MQFTGIFISDLITNVEFTRVELFKKNCPLNSICTDTRTLENQNNEQTIFFALSTSLRKGSNFIEQAYASGVRNFVVETNFNTQNKYKDCNFLFTDDVLKSLQKFAAYYRGKFNIPVMGITGSNGKTIVKEWLAYVLSFKFLVAKSPKSYNSQLGVALSMFQMNKETEIGIFEAGISTTHEMKSLADIIKPNIGIFTNLGSAHSEGFSSDEEKLSEKLKLFAHAETIICNADDEKVFSAIKKTYPQKNIFCFGKKSDADVRILSVKEKQGKTYLVLDYKDNKIEIETEFVEQYSLNNIIQVVAAALYMGVDESLILKTLNDLPKQEMRLELLPGKNSTAIVNDSYNADIESLQLAIQFLKRQQQFQKHGVILSDFAQLRNSNNNLYTQIADIVTAQKIDFFIGVGHQMMANQNLFSSITQTIFFENTQELLQALPKLSISNICLLIKGARIFGFENVVKLLVEKTHQTQLEINLDNLIFNVKKYQSLLSPNVKTMAMVKALSYGSGTYEIAHVLQHHKIDYLAVAYMDEGVHLRKGGITTPIMVLNCKPADFDHAVEYNLEPEIFSFEILEQLIIFLAYKKIDRFKVHIKLDTGMHRLGFEEKDLDRLVDILKKCTNIYIESVFTHLVATDDTKHDNFTQNQIDLFTKICNRLKKDLSISFLKHALNTTGISRWANAQFDMVRLGIGMYGIDGNVEFQNELKIVTELYTSITQLRWVKKGESVGYGRSEFLKRDTLVATVCIGYADGLDRRLSNGLGYMMVNNCKCPIIGRICMDMTMIDVTDVPQISIDDRVEVFGANIRVQHLAELLNTIPYEVLTNIGSRVKRIYVKE